MRFPLYFLLPILVVSLWPVEGNSAATILPPPETCFQALTPTSGGANGTGTGFVGLLGTITGGSGGTAGTYGGVALTGGNGTNATANITVAGGTVTAVTILNPGAGYVVGDVLSAATGNIGGTTGFSVPISSVYINQSLAGGSVTTYIPSTNTLKQTWFNADQSVSHQNANPVNLDANGCAIIYGTGSYRFLVKDSLGNTIYDQVTADTSAQTNSFWAGQATGTPNAQTVVDAGFNSTDGSNIGFYPAATNTGATTLTIGSSTFPVVKDGATGPGALTGGEIVASSPSNVVWVTFSSVEQNFHIINLLNSTVTATVATPSPQGYLNLLGVANGGPVQGSADVSAATTVYYSPFVGSQIPIWNGSSFSILSFSELQLALSASLQTANNIYDVFIFNNGGTPVAVFGPAWATPTAGSGARGTGAGTTQLSYQNGILVNTVALTGNNGSTTYPVLALQGTYVGSILVDTTAGQVTAHRTLGVQRKFGVWNAYNRVPIVLSVAQNTTPWTYTTATWRQSNGTTSDTAQVFTGLTQEQTSVDFRQQVTPSTGPGVGFIGIGVNSTTTPSGMIGNFGFIGANNATGEVAASYIVPPTLGLNNINCLENTSGNVITFAGTGTASTMYMTLQYRG